MSRTSHPRASSRAYLARLRREAEALCLPAPGAIERRYAAVLLWGLMFMSRRFEDALGKDGAS